MLESKIERAVCDYARAKGLLVDKFSSPGKRSVPDRLFTLPSGHMFLIEFKRTGGKETVEQARDHARRRAHNVYVAVVNDIDQGKAIIDKMCAGLGL